MAANDNGLLKTSLHEPRKCFLVYDINGRCTDIYEARSNAVAGDPCMHTQYEYDGSSARVLKSKETEADWDAAWDI